MDTIKTTVFAYWSFSNGILVDIKWEYSQVHSTVVFVVFCEPQRFWFSTLLTTCKHVATCIWSFLVVTDSVFSVYLLKNRCCPCKWKNKYTVAPRFIIWCNVQMRYIPDPQKFVTKISSKF
jgi:hypothetical protein